ncbi:polysaccharide chain length determinant protein [Salinisphaera dokdonensis CL-ES53]|uniref:Polysaccharide chain length determinant protein n=1 Tax=Salinisphaera dokdonensis CL-ES53 TaxID=1304272 RepID=A0ABV2B4C8_9GAMM
MQELLSRIFDELRNAWRYRWRGLLIAWILAVTGWLFVYSLPNQYQVDARVHIDTKSAIHPLLKGLAVLPDVKQQVDLLIQTVLSRPNLKDIARRTGLDIKASTPEAEVALLDKLANRIRIRNAGYSINLYSVSFSSSSAETARAVVQQVINIMTSMALADGGADSAQAMTFLSREVESHKGELESLERELANFQKDNANLMPGREDYVTRVQSMQDELIGLKEKLAAANEQRRLLQGQVASARSGGSRIVPAEQSEQVREIDARLEQAERNLDQLLSRYTPQYPDVVSLQRDIDRMRSERAGTVARLRRNPERVTYGGGGDRVAQRELAEVELEIGGLVRTIERRQATIDALVGDADEITEAQAQLAQLRRNYDSTKDQYEKLLGRLYSAQLSDEVERSGNGLKFNVIDPPETPAEPAGPQRALLMAVVLIGSLGAGGVFSFLMSQIRPVFINRQTLTEFTGLPVLGAVTQATSVRQNVQRQTALILFLVGVGTLFIGYAGAVAFAPMGTRMVPTFVSNQWL